MKMLYNLRTRPGARFLTDVDIPEESWKPDFDIVDRYQNFANELMRISLLGIAGYGFLIKEICMKDPKYFTIFSGLADPVWSGAICLCISLVLVLAHRFFSTSCLFYQILIMRSLKRLNNPHWTENEKELENKFLKGARVTQRIKSRTSHFILISASVFFSIGLISVVIVFFKFFSAIH